MNTKKREHRFLYVNVCEPNAYRGHKMIDMEIAEVLSLIGKVDLIAPEKDWYPEVESDIRVFNYYPEKDVSTWIRKLCEKTDRGIVHRLDPYQHICNYHILKFIEELDQNYHYTAIIAGHLDVMAFIFKRSRKRLGKKIFVIEHTPDAYSNRVIRPLFDIMKNQVSHIVMEKAGIPVYKKYYRIKPERISYVPHPCNKISIVPQKKIYNIIGISNSNAENEIDKIIALEEAEGFFEKNRLKALFRTSGEEFDNGWLKVVRGWLGFSFEEYYSYILNADVLVAPFDLQFGARSSGTIMDGLSNRVPVVGSRFSTMLQYSREYPYVCKVYGNLSEMCSLVVDYHNRKTDLESEMNHEFDCFLESRSKKKMKNYYCRAIGLN